jgi:methionine aminopeptidase
VKEYDSSKIGPADIPIWSEGDVDKIRKACRLARKMITLASTLVSPGKTRVKLGNFQEYCLFFCVQKWTILIENVYNNRTLAPV